MLVLVSSLKLRKERRRQDSRGALRSRFFWGTHVETFLKIKPDRPKQTLRTDASENAEDARALLEVSVHADAVTIGREHRRLSLSAHPDRQRVQCGAAMHQRRRDLIIAEMLPFPPYQDCYPAGVCGRAG